MTPTLPACPRCFRSPVRAGARFCPRCGLADVARAAVDRAPVDVPVGGRVFRVLDRVAVGSVSAVYRCRFYDGPAEVEGVLKVARDARANDLLANEAATLRRLFAADPDHRFKPFLPFPEATFGMAGDDPSAADDRGGGPPRPTVPRQATVFRVHPEIRSPADELYTLADVRAAYLAGLDPRHAAWVWRRVLTVLGFAHATGVVHGAVLPPHVLVEPHGHRVVLVGWGCAAPAFGGRGVRAMAGSYNAWYRRERSAQGAPARDPGLFPLPSLDVALAARSMVELMGGDPLNLSVPATVDPAIARYFQRCAGFGPNARPDAGRLLADFDGLIHALWGPRQFVPLALPPKRRA
ncbi:MAG: hypothetical protein JWO31_3839 [Phycisphaerales bacterium]|nr:hypothetical protein [Phycisphaerales bacterium]